MLKLQQKETFIARQKHAIKVSPFHYDTDGLLYHNDRRTDDTVNSLCVRLADARAVGYSLLFILNILYYRTVVNIHNSTLLRNTLPPYSSALSCRKTQQGDDSSTVIASYKQEDILCCFLHFTCPYLNIRTSVTFQRTCFPSVKTQHCNCRLLYSIRRIWRKAVVSCSCHQSDVIAK